MYCATVLLEEEKLAGKRGKKLAKHCRNLHEQW